MRHFYLTILCFSIIGIQASESIQWRASPSNSVDFKSVLGKISINPKEKTVSGKLIYDFEIINIVDTIRIDAQNMSFTDVFINGKKVNFSNTTKFLKLFEGFKKGKNTLSFNYLCKPKQAMYFVGNQIWTQGQGKYTSHWFPSFDDVNEKLIFNLDIIFDKDYTVIANGILKEEIAIGNEILWRYRMQKPMSSYLLMLAIGKFENQVVVSKSGKSLQFFIEPADKSKFESTYRYSQQIFDFLEKEIGIEFSWQLYKQIPVRDFVYAGMENTTATIFARDFVVDSIGFNDKNYINVNAHELAHQWFGNLITAKSGKHHWLQEGFATYFALLAEKNIFGSDYYNYKMYQTALQLKYASKNDTIPILNERASSLSFYQKGAWALRFLDEEIGHEKFQKAIKNYLKKYKFQNVETANFLAEINKISDFDTAKFQNEWLEKADFDIEMAKKMLAKNDAMKQYFEVLEMAKKPFVDSKEKYEKLLTSKIYNAVKQQIIIQIRKIPFAEKRNLLNLALQTNDIQIRQTVAENLNEIPLDFKPKFESFLDDKSYITKEIALTKLWQSFPEDRMNLLEKTKNWIGFNDYNLRILWLNLSLQTNDYQEDNKIKFYEELLHFSSSNFETETRQNALENLLFLNDKDENYLPNLINAATHFKWQFAGFARTKIRTLLKNKPHRTYFENLISKLPDNEKVLLEKLLKE